MSERYRFAAAVIVSILSHIILITLSEYGIVNITGSTITIPEKKQENRLVFEIVETQPENAVPAPPEDARLASDRNTLAKDAVPEEADETDRPLTEGVAETKELPIPQMNPNTLMQMRDFVSPKKFNLSELKQGILPTSTKEVERVEKSKTSPLTSVLPKNQKTSPNDLGSLSLSTYEWDFAPYMLELKRKIGRNINPPKAFTELGIIDGKYVIQFVITRKGELKSIQILDSVGSKVLEETSANAIKYSAPFEPLPDDFPDQVLIVTGKFHYYIRRNS